MVSLLLTMFRTLPSILLILLLSLFRNSNVNAQHVDGADTIPPLPFEFSPPDSVANYLHNRDLNGDGKADFIGFYYSGGSHCCYTMEILLSGEQDTLKYPFEMDGGYIWGVDGSWPDQFHIKDWDQDGRDEIFMQIQTYNGRPGPIPRKWARKYGIKTNEISFDFREGKLQVADFP